VSQENLEIVDTALDAFMRGDYEGVLRTCAEDIEITQAAGFAGVPAKQHGHAGLLEAFGMWPEEWDDYRIEILRIADLGSHVLVTQIARGRGKGSGIPVAMPLALLFAVRGGKIREWLIFAEEHEALEAAGLKG
jgi:ketosteroid isomerase-like protein